MGLVVEDIAVRRGGELRVDGVSFSASAGQVTAMLGPNGAGKTTTFGAIVSLHRLERGSITFDAQPIARTSIGYAPQVGSMYPYITGLQNALAFAAFARVARREREDVARAVIEIAQLEGREDDRLATYSGGMRQRLSLAIATIGRPDLILLDEPTAGVDPQARLHLLDWVRAIADERSAAVVYSSHYLEEIEYLCDRAIVVDGGRTVVEGSLAELTAASSSRLSLIATIDDAELEHLGRVSPGVLPPGVPTKKRLVEQHVLFEVFVLGS